MTDTTDQDIRQQAADAVLEEGIDFAVVNDHPTIIERIRYRTWRGPVRRAFVIKPITMGTLLRISKLILSTEQRSAAGKTTIEYGADTIAANKDVLVEIAACAITNRDVPPPRSLVRYLDANMTAPELRKLLAAVTRQMGILDFFGCMVSLRGMNMLGGTGERETSGEQSAVSRSTSGSDGTTSSGAEAGRTS